MQDLGSGTERHAPVINAVGATQASPVNAANAGTVPAESHYSTRGT